MAQKRAEAGVRGNGRSRGRRPAARTDNVFVLPVSERWLIHAPLHRVTALANGAAVGRLKKGFSHPGAGALSELDASLERESDESPRPPSGPLNPEFLGLIPTRSCNLGCVYCGFGASEDGSRVMDLSLAASAVDWMVEHVRVVGRPHLDVHFFGGEPFCAPDVVDVAVHRARAKAAQAGLTTRFEVATNGFFDEDRCRFVGDYFDTVVLSFDGPEEVQNRHRPARTRGGSFATVVRNARSLSASPAELCLRACVTGQTVGELKHITRWFCETVRPASITYESVQLTPEARDAGLFPPDPWAFAAALIRASRTARSHGITSIYATAQIDTLRHSFCPVGRDTFIVSPDGRISACYLQEREWQSRGLDLNLGRMAASGQLSLDPKAVRRIRELTSLSTRCERCFAKWHCAGGCVVNHSYPGCPDIYDDFCIQTRIITACRLLENLDRQEDLEGLLGDRSALERLALNPSDRLTDWEKRDEKKPRRR